MNPWSMEIGYSSTNMQNREKSENLRKLRTNCKESPKLLNNQARKSKRISQKQIQRFKLENAKNTQKSRLLTNVNSFE